MLNFFNNVIYSRKFQNYAQLLIIYKCIHKIYTYSITLTNNTNEMEGTIFNSDIYNYKNIIKLQILDVLY